MAMALVIYQFSVESKYFASESGKAVICDQATHRVFDRLNSELMARQYRR